MVIKCRLSFAVFNLFVPVGPTPSARLPSNLLNKPPDESHRGLFTSQMSNVDVSQQINRVSDLQTNRLFFRRSNYASKMSRSVFLANYYTGSGSYYRAANDIWRGRCFFYVTWAGRWSFSSLCVRPYKLEINVALQVNQVVWGWLAFRERCCNCWWRSRGFLTYLSSITESALVKMFPWFYDKRGGERFYLPPPPVIDCV